MRERKGQGLLSSRTVGIIAAVVALVALLYVVGAFKFAIELFAGKATCAVYAAVGGSGECVHRVTLSKENLTLKRNFAIRGINKWQKDEKYANTATYFIRNWNPSYSEDDAIPYEYLMDEVFASELKYCKDIAKLYEFKDWWKGHDKTKDADNEEDALGLWEKLGLGRPPILCLLCSRIKFDEELQRMFDGMEIKSLTEWMANTPVLPRKSYYEYMLFEGADELAMIHYTYSTSEPYAIVYSRIDKVGIRWAYGKAISFFNWFGANIATDKDADIKGVIIVPYAEFSRQCDYPFS